MTAARPGGTIGKPRGLKPGAVKVKAGTELSSRGKVRASKSVTPSTPGNGRMKPLRGVGAAVAGNLKGFSGLPVIVRTRSQAASAQRERNRRLFEFSRSAPGYDGRRSDRGIKIRKVTTEQPNMLTGRTDRIVRRVRATETGSTIGRSQASRNTQRRRDRAEARYDSLLQERKSIMGKGRVRSGVLARNSRRMDAVSGAFRVYDMGTGRKTPKRSTAPRRR
jgi:hypothetical protein